MSRLLPALKRQLRRAMSRPWWPAALLVTALVLWPPRLLERLDMVAYDVLAGDVLASRGDYAEPTPGNAVVVAIDDTSLQLQGSWPWSRKAHAALIDRLHEAGAGVIAYDVQFGLPAADEGVGADAELAAAMRQHARVVLPVHAAGRAGMVATGLVQPQPALRAAAAALGHTELAVDTDGAVRRQFLEARAGTHTWAAMPQAVLRLQTGGTALLRRPDAALARPSHSADRDVPWVFGEPRWLTAGSPPILQLSAARVLHDRSVDDLLRGRTVWVGVTAGSLAEPIATPAARPANAWSRLTWQAQVHQALSDGSLVERAPPGWHLAAAVLPLLAVSLLPRLTRRSPDGWLAGALLAMTPLPIVLAVAALLVAGWWIPPTAAVLGWLLAYAAWRSGQSHATRVDLERVRRHAGATLRAISDAVITIDSRLRVMLINPVATQMAGLSSGTDAQGQSILHLLRIAGADRERLRDAIDRCVRLRHAVELARPVALQTHGERFYVQITASPVIADPRDASDRELRENAVVVMKDVTESMLAAARLQHEATHDMLTGLPNRAMLATHTEAALARCHALGGSIAVLFVDLDRFKRINESLGHRLGDSVLELIARRLVAGAGTSASVVRWGGDEFVVLLEDLGDALQAHAHAQAVAQRLVQAVGALIELEELDVHCSCSIGMAVGPEQGQTLDDLLTAAEIGMRRAKVRGGARVEVGAPATANLPSAPPWMRDVLTMEARLRRALAEGALELHYQPQLDVASSEPVGMEALLRWRQPDGVMWAPGQFLDVAEESSLILDIGAWAIREAARQMSRWRDAGVVLLPVSINVSARQCLDRRLVQVVSQVLADEHIPASLLKLEITETTAMTDLEQVLTLLTELRALGVGVAVDDFGTGYSSLAHLQRLPIDQIKIDQSFVRDIAKDRQGAAIVRATIALAHELGVPVVAEGVEHESQLSFLALHHCDMAQGFYFARPLSGLDAGLYLRQAQRGDDPDGQRTLAVN